MEWFEGPPEIEWVKNDPKKYNRFSDESRFLVAVQVKNSVRRDVRWEFDVVTVKCDGDWMVLEYGGGETYDAWNFSDFGYFKLLDGEMPTYDSEFDPEAPSEQGKTDGK